MGARARLVGVVALAVALIGCGGSSGGSAPTVARLQARLLTASDVGSAWKVGQSINEQDLAAFAQPPCPGTTVDPAVVKRLTAVTGIQFEPVDGSYKHLIELVTSGSSGQLDRDVKVVTDSMSSCSTSAAAAKAKITVKPMTLPALGDQRAAYAVTHPQSATSTLYLRIAYVRLGRVAVAIGMLDLNATAKGAPQISDATFVQIVKTASDKLGGA